MQLGSKVFISAATLIFATTLSSLAQDASNSYSIKFALKTSDGRYFGGTAVCKKNSDCHVQFDKGFRMSLIDYKDSYSFSIYNISDEPSLQRCCSFENGKDTISLYRKNRKHAVRLYNSVRQDLSYKKLIIYGDIFIDTSGRD